jgi:hypothetical protein
VYTLVPSSVDRTKALTTRHKMTSTGTTDDLTEKLTKLAKLRSDGVLSDEEFKTLKAKLIAGIRTMKLLKRDRLLRIAKSMISIILFVRCKADEAVC